jgi:chromosome segregation ATPase
MKADKFLKEKVDYFIYLNNTLDDLLNDWRLENFKNNLLLEKENLTKFEEKYKNEKNPDLDVNELEQLAARMNDIMTQANDLYNEKTTEEKYLNFLIIKIKSLNNKFSKYKIALDKYVDELQNAEKEIEKAKRVFSDEDPYGEEDWSDGSYLDQKRIDEIVKDINYMVNDVNVKNF